MVAAPHVGLGGHQRGAVLAVTWPVEVRVVAGSRVRPGGSTWCPVTTAGWRAVKGAR